MIEEIPEALDGERIDRVVSMQLDISRSAVRRLIEQGDVCLDGKVATTRSSRVHTGQMLAINNIELLFDEVALEADASIEVPLLHVDEDVIVVDKPVGLVVHPGAGNNTGTICQGLLATFPEIAEVGEPSRPGIVHRLDKGTSGAFMVARSAEAYESLVDQLRDRSVGRRYLAFGWGDPDTEGGVIDAPIGRAIRDPTRMVVKTDGKPARTHYQVLARWHDPTISLVECRLETGRTHQIRVHMAAIHHPVVGDARYGGGRGDQGLTRPALHASDLSFDHPATGERLSFHSPLPSDLVEFVDGLGAPTSGGLE